MKRLSWTLVVAGGLSLGTLAYAQAPAGPASGRYIVTLQAGEDPASVARSHGLAPDFLYQRVLNGFAGRVPPGRLRALLADTRVAAVTPDNMVEVLGKPAAGGKPPPASSQVVPAGVDRIGAKPGAVAFTGAGVGVAVTDTGLDFNHADLAPLGAASFHAYGASAQDDNGHGTHVGGIIAARNNTRDVVGVAPGATLYAVKVLDANGYGFDSDVIAGLDWVAANAASVTPRIRVVNMSLGRGKTADDSAFQAAVQRVVNAGIAVVVAAGNDPSQEVKDMVPAGLPEVIAVASTTAKNGTTSKLYGYIAGDTASYFTTDGAMDLSGVGVAISAPGEDQEDLSNGGFITSVGILSTKLGGGTTRFYGTSMASPHAAGVAALLYQKDPSSTPVDAKLKVMGGVLEGAAPRDSATSKGYLLSGYTYDGEREGILNAPIALK